MSKNTTGMCQVSASEKYGELVEFEMRKSCSKAMNMFITEMKQEHIFPFKHFENGDSYEIGTVDLAKVPRAFIQENEPWKAVAENRLEEVYVVMVGDYLLRGEMRLVKDEDGRMIIKPFIRAFNLQQNMEH